MPVHDWTRVEASVFHDFHTVWTGMLRNARSTRASPQGYYAMAEQHAGRTIPHILMLHASPALGATALSAAAPWRFATSAATASSR